MHANGEGKPANRAFSERSDSVMSAIDNALAEEMRSIVEAAAEPASLRETAKAQLNRAWEALGRPPFWRVRAAWKSEAGCWAGRAHEDFRRRDRERRAKETKGRDQARQLAAIYAKSAERLRQIDPEFHSAEIARLEHAARALGALDSPVDRDGG